MTLHHSPVLIFTTPAQITALAALVTAGHRARRSYGTPASQLQQQITDDILTAYRTVTAAGQQDVPTTPETADYNQDDYLTTGEVAAVLGLSPRHTRRLANTLGARPRGGSLMWPTTEVHAYAQHLKGTAA